MVVAATTSVRSGFGNTMPAWFRRQPRQAGLVAPSKIETLVVSGGGMKGMASLGAVVALKKTGALRHVTTVVGTSAGALVAAALVTDRASPRIIQELAASAYKPDIDLSRLLASFGIDSGAHLDRWIAALLGGPVTFRDLHLRTGTKLVVCATNLTERKPEYFSVDTAPDMDVSLALRMSCSVPLYFSAVRHGGNLYVDGAVADNFPMHWATDHARAADRVLGIAFRARASNPSAGLEDYVGALLECSTRRHYKEDDKRVLLLDTGARSAFEFGMSPRDMKKLYSAGARQARAWVKKEA